MEILKNIPSLRFPEFKGEWEEKKLGEIATNKSAKFNPVKEKSFTKCIELEHLGTETGQLLGFIDGSNSGSIKNKFNEGDVLFGKLRPYLKKYLQAPFKGVCSSEIWVLNGIKITNSFLYRIVQTDKFIDLANQSSGSKMPRADWNVVENGIFSFPTLTEQQKIASFLTAVDYKLQALKQKKTLLEQFKKGVSQKIFSKELRFYDDNGNDYPDWEDRKLGEVLVKNSKKNKNQEFKLVQSVSNKRGFVNQDEYFEDRIIASKDLSNYYVIQKGDFAYNPSRIDVGSLAYKFDDKQSVISPLYISFKANKDFLNDVFLLEWFSTQQFTRQMNSSFEGSVRNTLSYESLQKIGISFPNHEEQYKIGNFLSAIDDKINHCQEQIVNTEVWKKGLLQQMFV